MSYYNRYLDKFSPKSIAEALFHNQSDINLRNKDLEIFHRTEDAVWIDNYHYILKTKELHKNI